MVAEFLKRNWLGLLGLVVGVAGLVASVYFYEKGVKYRQPIFIVDPVRTQIVNRAQLSSAPIRIIKSNGEEIRSDASSLQFYFWNEGSESIRESNVLEAITFRLDDPNDSQVQILDYRLLGESRTVVHPFLRANPNDPTRSLVLSFDILEHRDGVTGQLIYEGSPAANLTVSGTIEGTPKIAATADVQSGRFWHEVASKLWMDGLLAAALTIFFWRRDVRTPVRRAAVIFALSFSFFVALGVSEVRRNATTTVVQMVPQEILPKPLPTKQQGAAVR
jgi:hypothetical protein